jgi:hypothetical protein
MGVEKAVRSLPVEKVEEARQESVRIIKATTRTKDNLTKTERVALRTLKDNTHLTILPADKGNATAILNTYNLTPGKYPKEHIQYSKHGGSLKSGFITCLPFCDFVLRSFCETLIYI